ncbi:MAG: TonB-dependent receptor [Gammaproteobacteria bacterium]|nr:TonB-dependent receptor [Gammaproteobacteria bacterium]
MACVLALAFLVPVAAVAGAGGAKGDAVVAGQFRFDIPSQPVGKALIQFGAQTGLSVIVQHDARTVATNAVVGIYTIPEGLRVLLRDTGLDYRYQDSGVVVSRKPALVSPVPSSLMPPDESIPGDRVAPIAGPFPSAQALAEENALMRANNAGPPDVVVTGSRIGLPPSQVSSHVVVVTDPGGGNIGGAIDDLPQNIPGGNPLNPGIDLLANEPDSLGGTTFVQQCQDLAWGVDSQQLSLMQATNLSLGMTPMNLRGIGSRGTLVLVNGKRIGRSGLLGGYADLSSIPMDMVERVEIQLDGASALYGSDAVGGIVNVILRDQHEGTTVKLRRTTGLAGAFDGINALLASTKAWGSGRATGLLGYYTTKNRIPYDDPAQDFLASANPSFGDDLLFRESERFASRQRTYFRIAVDQDLPANIDASISLAYTPGETEHRTGFRPATIDVSGGDSPSPSGLAAQMFGATELPAMFTQAKSDRWTLSANVDGSFDTLPGWEWHLGIDHTRENSNSTTKHELSRELLRDALLAGSFDTSTDASPEDRYRPFLLSDQTLDASNEDLLLEFTLKRSFAAMPAGNLDVLFGVSSGQADVRFEHQRDALARHLPIVAHGPIGMFPIHPGAPGDGDADLSGVHGVVLPDATGGAPGSAVAVTSAFAEFQIPLVSQRPLVEKLSVNAAVRQEDTSLHGANTTWSVGAVWNINDDLRVRLRKGTSFSAPPLWLSSLPTTTTPLSVFLDDRGGASEVLCCPLRPCDATIVSGGRTSLRGESAVSWSYGIEFTPARLKGFRSILNYSKIHFRDRIDGVTPLTLSLIPRLTDDLFDRYGSVYRFDEEGEFLGIDARAANVGSQIVATYDWTADYQRETVWGTWSLSASVTMYDRFESRLGSSEVVEDLVGLPYAVPKFKQHARVGWTRGNWRLALNASHRDDADRRYGDINSHILLKYPVVLDFGVTYRLGNDRFGALKNMRLNLGASNLAGGHTRWVETSWNTTGYQSRSASYTEVTSPWTERTYFMELVHTL